MICAIIPARMTEALNKTAIAQSATALIIAITLVETVRDLVGIYKPDTRHATAMLRIFATVIIIGLAFGFMWLHPWLSDAQPAALTGGETSARENFIRRSMPTVRY